MKDEREPETIAVPKRIQEFFDDVEKGSPAYTTLRDRSKKTACNLDLSLFPDCCYTCGFSDHDLSMQWYCGIRKCHVDIFEYCDVFDRDQFI